MPVPKQCGHSGDDDPVDSEAGSFAGSSLSNKLTAGDPLLFRFSERLMT